MTTLVAHAQPDVGDLKAPDPQAVAWLEETYWPAMQPTTSYILGREMGSVGATRRMFQEIPDGLLYRSCPSCPALFGSCEHSIIIEPTDETIQAAAADFRDGFWADVPYKS